MRGLLPWTSNSLTNLVPEIFAFKVYFATLHTLFCRAFQHVTKLYNFLEILDTSHHCPPRYATIRHISQHCDLPTPSTTINSSHSHSSHHYSPRSTAYRHVLSLFAMFGHYPPRSRTFHHIPPHFRRFLHNPKDFDTFYKISIHSTTICYIPPLSATLQYIPSVMPHSKYSNTC